MCIYAALYIQHRPRRNCLRTTKDASAHAMRSRADSSHTASTVEADKRGHKAIA